jgi:hypothetical protein
MIEKGQRIGGGQLAWGRARGRRATRQANGIADNRSIIKRRISYLAILHPDPHQKLLKRKLFASP